MAKKILIVVGSPGAGKTTILKAFSDIPGISIVNLGTLMLEFGLARKYVKQRDELRYLDGAKFDELRNMAIDKINSTEGNVIIDTHASVGENGRYMPGLPLGALDQFGHRVTGLVYIDATTKDILDRRKNDSTRKREKEDETMIDDQRLINLSTLAFASSYLNAPLFVVVNKAGEAGVEESIKDIKSRLGEIFGD
jgi:adenylate kinase